MKLMNSIIWCIFAVIPAYITTAPCFPGENIWRLTDDVCSMTEVNDSAIEAVISSIYDVVLDIEAEVQALSQSSTEELSSLIGELITELDSANSVIEDIVTSLDSFAADIQSVIDAISTIENIDTMIITETCSCIDADLNSLTAVLATTIDGLESDFDVCCSTISIMDSVIKSDVDSVSTKVDSVSSQVSEVKSDLDVCCATIQNLYNCEIGTAITQAMVSSTLGYTISASGNYYVCEDLSVPNPIYIITIAANNVCLDLNGHTLAGGCAVSCQGYTNVQVKNGTVRPGLNGIGPFTDSGGLNIINCSNVKISDITVLGNGETTFFNIQSSVNVEVDNCIGNGTTNPQGFVFTGGPARITNTRISNIQTFEEAEAFLILPTAGVLIELENCVADNVQTNNSTATGFQVSSATVVLRNCIASNIGFYGFYGAGGIHENCIARNAGIGFLIESSSATAVYKNCIADNGGTGFYIAFSHSLVLENCVANDNSGAGFEVDGTSGSNVNVILDTCLGLDNATGFSITNSNTGIVLTNCIAAGNTGAGISNASASTVLVDCRSQHAATTLNPAYNLNGAADSLGGATVVITS